MSTMQGRGLRRRLPSRLIGRTPQSASAFWSGIKGSMHEELQAMQQMKCPMIGFPGNAPSGKAPPDTAKGTGGSTKGGGLMGADSKNCHQMMETRMDMTAALLEQMLEHEEAER